MDPYEQARLDSIQKINRIQGAVNYPTTPMSPIIQPTTPQQPGIIETYIKSGISLSRLKEEGWTTPLSMAYNFVVPGIVQDIANIPSNLIGGGLDIAAGQTNRGLGRIGLGALDLATTIFTGGGGKVVTKGAQKYILGGALKGLEGEALQQAGKQIIKKEVVKGVAGGAGIGAAYGLSGGLKDLDRVPENQRAEYLINNTLLGGVFGGVTGGLFTGLTARNALNLEKKMFISSAKPSIYQNTQFFNQAKDYASFDDFLKTIPTFFHGSPTKFTKIKKGAKLGVNEANEDIYLTPQKQLAETYKSPRDERLGKDYVKLYDENEKILRELEMTKIDDSNPRWWDLQNRIIDNETKMKFIIEEKRKEGFLYEYFVNGIVKDTTNTDDVIDIYNKLNIYPNLKDVNLTPIEKRYLNNFLTSMKDTLGNPNNYRINRQGQKGLLKTAGDDILRNAEYLFGKNKNWDTLKGIKDILKNLGIDGFTRVHGFNNRLNIGQELETIVFDKNKLLTKDELQKLYNESRFGTSESVYTVLEKKVLDNFINKNYEDLFNSPLNKKGEYVIDFVDQDLQKASLEAIANSKPGYFRNLYDKYFSPTKILGKSMEEAFANWVNTRNATGVYSFLKFKEFKKYVDDGIQGILDFEKNASKFPGIKKYFDDMHEVLVKTGILKQDQYFQEVNYLPLMFDNTKEEIAEAFRRKKAGEAAIPFERAAGETAEEFERRRRLSMKPSFTFERVIQGYNEGVALGLTPKITNLAELVQFYEKSARKAIADRNFFNTLVGNRWVVPSRKAPADWVELGGGFPRYTSRTKDGFLEDRYAAPPEFANVINNYLQTNNDGVMTNIGKFFDGVKQRLLTAGIPNTGINFHGFSTLMRYTFGSGKNPFTSFFQGVGFMINPNAALRRMERSLQMLPQAVESGLIVSEGSLKKLLYNKEQLRKELESTLKDKGFVTKNFSRIWNMYKDIVEDPLMEKIIPAYKIETWQNTYNTYKKFMPDAQARRRAAEFTNTLLGGLNYDEIGRSREVRDLMKFFLLAPDWFETNVNLGVRSLKSFWDTDKNYRAYRTMATNLMGSYIFFNGINKAMSGHYMWENEPGQKFSLDTGTKDEQGNTRYIQMYGTGVDFVRLPFDFMDGIVNGDNAVLSRLARNRLSPIGSTLVSLYSNTDYAGRPLFGTDKFGRPLSFEEQALGASSVVGQAIGIPTIFGEPIRNVAEEVITGKKVPLERKVTEAIDLPVRYKAAVSDITKLERERTLQRREFEQALISGNDAKINELSKNFTDREISTLISNITNKEINNQLNTREKLFNRLSEQQKLELARTNPEFAAMYQKIAQLEAQKETNPINKYKETLQGKPEIKKVRAKKARKPRKGRVRKVRAKRVRVKKLRAIKQPKI